MKHATRWFAEVTLLSLSLTINAETRYVDLNSPSPATPFTSWATAATNIQDAVDAAAAGDLVLVTNGTYQTGARAVYGLQSNRVAVTKPVAVQSVNGPEVTMIVGRQVPGTTNGYGAIRCVYLTNGASLSGFTLTNGATLTDTFAPAGAGGGVYCVSTSAVVTNCTLINNSAYYSGGGACYGSLNRCALIGNSANSSSSVGGGAYYASLTNCVVRGNTAYSGGGTVSGSVNNSLLISNSAAYLAGAAYNGMLNNCTVVGNSAGFRGGGTSCVVLYNSIVYYNAAPGLANYIDNTLHCCCTTPMPTVSGNITNEPLFVDLAAGNFHLATNSPCINAGSNSWAVGAVDFEGNPRIVGGTVDIGAYEWCVAPCSCPAPATSAGSRSRSRGRPGWCWASMSPPIAPIGRGWLPSPTRPGRSATPIRPPAVRSAITGSCICRKTRAQASEPHPDLLCVSGGLREQSPVQMNLSVFSLFNIGIGPSSSHTVGPMRAAHDFVERLAAAGRLRPTARIVTTLYGALGATGKGHSTDKAIVLGLLGERPETVPIETLDSRLRDIRRTGRLPLPHGPEIDFREKEHLVFDCRNSLPTHANGMKLEAFDRDGRPLSSEIYYSTGGGFIVREGEPEASSAEGAPMPYPFESMAELLAQCRLHGLGISDLMLANEKTLQTEAEIRARLARIWEVMQQCVANGCKHHGRLPGGLKIQRRAPELHRKLASQAEQALRDPLTIMDWVNLYAMAVNEENAAGSRVVTAPTNGAAGIIPAVLHYATRFCTAPHPDSVARFLLAAGAIGMLYKMNASISGADVGCQGEVGVACSMAAGGLVEYLGGTPAQVENAAEIGMEHNLGLTCDPIGGLVQIPCIERNAMGSIKAINAARIALRGDGHHFVSLDKVIRTMRDTGRDMLTKYKETARGGLAVNMVEC